MCDKCFADNDVIGAEAASLNAIATLVGVEYGETDGETEHKRMC
jgi:hypothetical protein